MKKLQLNKQTIAQLDTPEKIYGGDPHTAAPTCGTCESAKCGTIYVATCAPRIEDRCGQWDNGMIYRPTHIPQHN